MALLMNPIFLRMALVFIIAIAAFGGGIVLMRVLRRRIVEGDSLPDGPGLGDTIFPYSAVIQELKQQKFVLQNEQSAERRKAKTSEQIMTAVIANLPCGILFIGPNGLVRQVNAAARQILGFASPLGMGLDELFRDAQCTIESAPPVSVAAAFRKTLQEQARTDFDALYSTANGQERSLTFALIPLVSPSGEKFGIAAVIIDESGAADLRRSQVLHTEIAVEMALELRSSLSTIRACAAQIGSSGNSAIDLAKDISVETERLEQVVGDFLSGRGEAKASAATA